MARDNCGIDLYRTETFTRLLSEHEQKLARYAMILVPHLEDADDILQESKLIMWRSFDQFVPGTNFSAWARKIVFHQVLKYRRQPARRSQPFSEDTIMLLEKDANAHIDTFDPRSAVLAKCIKKLSEVHRKILVLRYNDELSIEEISVNVDRSPEAVYRVLSRIRQALRTCASNTVEESKHTEL